MRVPRWRTWLAVAAVPGLALSMALPASAQSRAASTATAGPRATVIMVMRDQNTALAAGSRQRLAEVRTEQASVRAQLDTVGARNVISTSVLNAVIANVPVRSEAALAANPEVAQILPNSTIPGPTLPKATGPDAVPAATGHEATTVAPASCGTSTNPELDPEALTNINATPSQLGSNDGHGVTVAYIADGVDPTNGDFQRNAAFASAGSPTGSPVVTQVNLSGDPAGAPTTGGEAFGDASTIAAQGNQVYDLSTFVNAAHPLPAGCDIKIVGAAPGAKVLALDVFSSTNTTTNSAFLQAIDYAVNHGAKVINESFGTNAFPDTSLDLTRIADDAAVKAGVTVVASSGDAGFTSTIGSPGSDPDVISAGASTTFRSHEQESYGGTNWNGANGLWGDNNISSLSSGGFNQSGGTVDLVAPGDLNWALCSTKESGGNPLFTECVNQDNSTLQPIEDFGGTSESSPFTAAGAADVISAYAATHGGKDPSPALIRQFLISTAQDIKAPATEQGAGLLDIAAAVNLARSYKVAGPRPGGVLISPSQINVAGGSGRVSTRTITLTNTGSSTAKVFLSTRALTTTAGNSHGSFCMQPGTPTVSCPANTGTFPIFSGVNEVYQVEHFTVPAVGSSGGDLEFASDYQNNAQTSVLHFALFSPNGTFEAYSEPQGFADFGQVEVSDPTPGTWSAVFFTEANGATAGAVGTSGTIQWDAKTMRFGPAGKVSPASVTIAAGRTVSTHVRLVDPVAAGDSAEAVAVSSGSQHTTIPVTIRVPVTIGRHGGSFRGVLTGGNGRAGAQAQQNTYVFNVPRGERDLDVSVHMATDRNDFLTGYLVNPQGQTVGYSENIVVNSTETKVVFSPYVNMYNVDPEPGQWRLLLQWANPVTGLELSANFNGTIKFNQVHVTGRLPAGSSLKRGKSYTFTVKVKNTGLAPEAYFVDPRLSGKATYTLVNINSNANASDTPVPVPAANAQGPLFPFYLVPTQTSQTTVSVTRLTGSQAVNMEWTYAPGDPDLEGTSTSHGRIATVNLKEPEISPGEWAVIPAPVGPYGAGGASADTAKETVRAVTRAFDRAVSSPEGDLFEFFNGLTHSFQPVYLLPGQTATIKVTIKPTASVRSTVRGTLFIADVTLGSLIGTANPDGDDIAAIPYHYKVIG
jgi:Subtilase family